MLLRVILPPWEPIPGDNINVLGLLVIASSKYSNLLPGITNPDPVSCAIL